MSIKAVDLNYVYGGGTAFEQHALFDVNLEIEDGEFVGLIGHTGSGKSTLIQHLNGLIKASAGELYYNGENIYSHYYKQSPFELSGGQKRRVAIAGVLAMEPEVLILDEPTAGLDPRGRDEILDQIDRLHRERHMTIILVSHSMEDVARYADRLIVMNHGQKVFDGAPKEVFRHYRELETMGLAAPQITYLVHDLKAKGIDIDNDITTVPEAREAILALRNKLTESSRDKNV